MSNHRRRIQRNFMRFLAGGLVLWVAPDWLSAAEPERAKAEESAKVTYLEHPLAPSQVQPAGVLAERLRFNLTKLIRDRKRQHTLYSGWGADQIGRWIGSTILEATLLQNQADLPAIGEKVTELLAAQNPAGFYYGKELQAAPDRERACWFGQGRGIWNLLEYYDVTGDEPAKASILKAADYVVAKRGEWVIGKPLGGGIESAVSPMARLGRMAERPQYVAWARDIADNIQHQVARPSAEPTAHVEATNLITHEQKPFYHHTHSYLSTTHGVVDLAVVTGERKYLDQARDIFEQSCSSVWINGDFPESYGDYYERCDEICSAVDWMMLSLKLYAATGEARYLDWAELTALNQLMFGLDHEGNFTCYRSLNRHHWMDPKNYGGPQTDCCSMSGGWGMAQAAIYTVTSDARGLSVNLPFDVAIQEPRKEGTLALVQEVKTDRHAIRQSIRVKNDSAEAIRIKVRAPYWCPEPVVAVDAQPVAVKPAMGFLIFECPARTARTIALSLPMKLMLVPARRNVLNRERADGAVGNAAEPGLMYGPYTLMFNRQMHPKVVQRDLRLRLRLDDQGRPRVSQELPPGWDARRGAVGLFIEAALEDGTPVRLTPCANLTLTKFTVADPYVMRFAEVKLHAEGSSGSIDLPLRRRDPNTGQARVETLKLDPAKIGIIVMAESPVMRLLQKPWPFDVPIPAGTRRLKLVVDDAGDGNRLDVGCWAKAGFVVPGYQGPRVLD